MLLHSSNFCTVFSRDTAPGPSLSHAPVSPALDKGPSQPLADGATGAAPPWLAGCQFLVCVVLVWGGGEVAGGLF